MATKGPPDFNLIRQHVYTLNGWRGRRRERQREKAWERKKRARHTERWRKSKTERITYLLPLRYWPGISSLNCDYIDNQWFLIASHCRLLTLSNELHTFKKANWIRIIYIFFPTREREERNKKKSHSDAQSERRAPPTSTVQHYKKNNAAAVSAQPVWQLRFENRCLKTHVH